MDPIPSNMNASPLNENQQALRVNVYEVRPTKGREGFDLISEAISLGRLRFS